MSTEPPIGEFLRGWRKLPDELKIEIISYLVPSNELLNKSQFDSKVAGYTSFMYTWDSYKHLVPLLSCPEVTPLVKEKFYNSNIVALRLSGGTLFLPPPSVLPLVRRLDIPIPHPYLIDDDFHIVACRFDNLQHVSLTVDGSTKIKGEVDSFLRRKNTVVIPTKTLKITCKHSRYRRKPGIVMDLDEEVDPSEMILLSRLVPGPGHLRRSYEVDRTEPQAIRYLSVV